MSLFGGYENAGVGIDPHAPKKKPFARFWELLWRNLGKLLLLNLIYVGFHIPLMLSVIFYLETNNALTNAMCIFLLAVQAVIAGPTLAGCTRVLRLITLDKAFFLWEEFKKGFTSNFLMATLIFVIDAIVAVSVYLGWFMYPQLADLLQSKAVYLLFAVSLAVALLLLFMNFFLLPMQVATNLKGGSLFKNALMLACLSPKTCLLTFICIAAILALCVLLLLFSSVFMFVFAFFPAAFIGYLVMFINYPVIQRYVINPYYADSGETNPEAEAVVSEEERVFTDRGGSETPIHKEKNRHRGKTIQ